MAYVIALPRVDVKDRACVTECPVDCIYESHPGQDHPLVAGLPLRTSDRKAGAAFAIRTENAEIVDLWFPS